MCKGPAHRATAGRAYSNGVYLGVTSGNDPNCPDGVWVLGGDFGAAPVRVGSVTDFITPVDTSGGGGTTGPNNGCYDLALMDTAGTHLVGTYQVTGTAAGSYTIDTTVGQVTGFEGHADARESVFTWSSSSLSGYSNQGKSYARRTGDAEQTMYGNTSASSTSLGGYSINTSSRSVNTPPTVDRTAGLAVGGSFTMVQTLVTTTTAGVLGLPDTVTTCSNTVTTVTTFVGRETVTVPAGTYATCRFDSKVTGTTGTVSNWVLDGKGVPVKSVTCDGNQAVTATSSATSLKLNGQAL